MHETQGAHTRGSQCCAPGMGRAGGGEGRSGGAARREKRSPGRRNPTRRVCSLSLSHLTLAGRAGARRGVGVGRAATEARSSMVGEWVGVRGEGDDGRGRKSENWERGALTS